jgi:hypothetical protein
MKKIILSIMMAMAIMIALPVPLENHQVIQQVQATTIKINKKRATIYKGKTVQLKISGTKKKVVWKSSNKKVATVSSKGKVTAKKKGTCTITATVAKKQYKCKITVKVKSSSKNVVSYVYIPRTGKKYHRNAHCSGMKSPQKVTLSNAKSRGYTACKKCF